MWKMPAMYVGNYAERDAELTLALWKVMQKEIIDQDLQSIFDLETDLFPCLVDMRFLGVKVDVQKAHTLKQQLASEEKSLLQKSKNRNRNRYSNMGSAVDSQSL
jgi:DNA polymerase I-like protein with 3'-5' exonuclease and polymerase domains